MAFQRMVNICITKLTVIKALITEMMGTGIGARAWLRLTWQWWRGGHCDRCGLRVGTLLTCFGSATPEALQPSPEIVQATLQVTGQNVFLIDNSSYWLTSSLRNTVLTLYLQHRGGQGYLEKASFKPFQDKFAHLFSTQTLAATKTLTPGYNYSWHRSGLQPHLSNLGGYSKYVV